MKRFRSIRWQLPATYAAIALLTALALGSLLLGLLSVYYHQREADYMRANASLVRENLTALIAQNAGADLLAEQVRALSFLTQTRIRLLDDRGNLLVDSGVPFGARLEVIVAPGEAVLPGSSQETGSQESGGYAAYIRIHPLPERPRIPNVTPDQPAGPDQLGEPFPQLGDFDQDPVIIFPREDRSRPVAVSGIPAVGSLFGYDLGINNLLFVPRTSLLTTFALLREEQGSRQVVGTVEMSESPALGTEIMQSVAWAMAAAGLAAVLLGGLAGWLVSRRINRPLLALATVTGRMADGDLTARAEPSGPEELGRLADAYNQMAERLAGLVAALRRFVADAAHQLNTPLTTLRVALDYLAGGLAEEDQRRVLGKARDQVAHLERLAGALLRLSRLESGASGMPHQPLDLVALLSPLCEEYASRAEQAGLEFELDLPGEVNVRGDPEELRMAVANLLDNAVKFTPPGGQVQVRLRAVDGWAELSVADSGIGIPPEDRAQLFSRFHRAGNAAAYPGTGLGLAIVHSVVERHAGQVAATALNPGTLFHLRLPLV